MLNTAGEIAKQAVYLVGDPNGDYTSESFVTTAIQLAQDDLMNYLYSNPNLSRGKMALVLPAVAAGTQSLSDYFTGKKEPSLALLKDIVSVREKPAGSNDAQYTQLAERNEIPVVQPLPYNNVYVWVGDNILLPGASQALDIRIWGTFEPQTITGYESPVLPNCKVPLVWGTAAMLAEGHSNDEKLERLNKKYEDTRFDLFNNIMLEMQFELSRQRAYGELSGTLD